MCNQRNYPKNYTPKRPHASAHTRTRTVYEGDYTMSINKALQCSAVCCSVLQCAAVCCCLLHYVAECGGVLKRAKIIGLFWRI